MYLCGNCDAHIIITMQHNFSTMQNRKRGQRCNGMLVSVKIITLFFSMIVTNCLIPSVTAKLSGTRFLAEDNRAVFLLNQYMLVNTSL